MNLRRRTNAKAGCENEFALFVETEPDCYLPSLAEYIDFIKGTDGDLNTINIRGIELLEQMKDKIYTIEIYYNPYTTKISPIKQEGVRYYNIFTQKEV